MKQFTVFCIIAFLAGLVVAEDKPGLKKAFVDGNGAGWRALTEEDFTKVNSAADTWSWKDGVIHCTGRPASVMRTKNKFTNFELVCEWMHLKSGGNSGIFVWTTEKSIERLTKAGKPGLPHGIEVQVLDLEYGGKKKADWYTSHGDVFPVGTHMKPFPPVAPNGKRSFPPNNSARASTNGTTITYVQ